MGLYGNKMKQAENIFTFDDFVELCQISSGITIPILLSTLIFIKSTASVAGRTEICSCWESYVKSNSPKVAY